MIIFGSILIKICHLGLCFAGVMPFRGANVTWCDTPSRVHLTLKGWGFFVYLKAGGRIPPPPPSDLGRGATKNSEIWHVRRASQYDVLTKLQILKIKSVFELCKFMLIICMFSYF